MEHKLLHGLDLVQNLIFSVYILKNWQSSNLIDAFITDLLPIYGLLYKKSSLLVKVQLRIDAWVTFKCQFGNHAKVKWWQNLRVLVRPLSTGVRTFVSPHLAWPLPIVYWLS